MKKQGKLVLLLMCIFIFQNSYTQSATDPKPKTSVSKLFMNTTVLPIKVAYSNKDLDKKTNDSTYIDSELGYQDEDGTWKNLAVQLRARGLFRRENCYFPPVKVKIKKSVAKGTLFEGNKRLKLVLPCLQQKAANDAVVKEYMGYKLYEIISPYHFKTRMVDVDFTESRGKNVKNHQLKGILIEDDDLVADRFGGKVMERSVHPLQQDDKTSVQNAFFQFMIGNTDFSTAFQHNQKLLFIDKNTITLPYDFDMSGLVDASYAMVSGTEDQTMGITSVKQRVYRGFKRDMNIINEVRQEYLDHKIQMMDAVDGLKSSFDDPDEFSEAKAYISSFFDLIADNNKFKSEIVDRLRTK